MPIDEVEVQLPIGDLGITFEEFPAAITEIKSTSPMLRHGVYVGMMVDTVRIGRHTTFYEMTPEKLSENLIHYRKNKNSTFKNDKCMIRFVAPHYVVTPPPIPKLVDATFSRLTKRRTIFENDNVSVISSDNEGEIVKNVSEDTAPDEDDLSDQTVKTTDKHVLQVKKLQPSQSKDEVVPQISFEDDISVYGGEKSVGVDNTDDEVGAGVDVDDGVENNKPSLFTPQLPLLSTSRRQKSAPSLNPKKNSVKEKDTTQNLTLKYPTYQRQNSAPNSSNYARGRAYATTTKPVINEKSEKLRDRFRKKRVMATVSRVTSSTIDTKTASNNAISTPVLTTDTGEWV